MSNLVSEIESISNNTKFNERQLLRGDQFTFYTDINIHGHNITTVESDMAITSLGIQVATVNIGKSVDQSDLDDVIAAIDNALLTVDTKRAHLGAVSNRFGHIMNNLQNVIDNTVRSKSIMIDADFSVEASALTRTTVLQQGATSMLAQANSQKNLVLTLFQ
jgi:flagellin